MKKYKFILWVTTIHILIHVSFVFPVSTEAPVFNPNECDDNVNCGSGSFCGPNSEGVRQCIGM